MTTPPLGSSPPGDSQFDPILERIWSLQDDVDNDQIQNIVSHVSREAISGVVNRTLGRMIETICIIPTTELTESVARQIDIIKLLKIQQDKEGIISDEQIVGIFAGLIKLKIEPKTQALSASFKTIKKALQFFRDLNGAPVLRQPDRESVSSVILTPESFLSSSNESDSIPSLRSGSDEEKNTAIGGQALAGRDINSVEFSGFVRKAPDTKVMTPEKFCDKLMENIQNSRCVVIGDGSHEAPALTDILSQPDLIKGLLKAGLTDILLEHVYQRHINIMLKNNDEGIQLLTTHLKKRTFPTINSEKETHQEFRDAQASVYAKFVGNCCDQMGLTVQAADNPVVYDRKDKYRLRATLALDRRLG